MILADTSVWVDFVRYGFPMMDELLSKNLICAHELVRVELTLWTPPNRDIFLTQYCTLEAISSIYPDQVCNFVNLNKFYGRGCGAVDMSLLASCAVHGAKLWTLDKRLNELAKSLGLAFP